jgi:type I restriction enzyme S subunit
MSATASEEQIKRLTLSVGDVIITKDSEDPRDIGIPAYIAEIRPNLVCGYHLALIRSNKDAFGEFLYYFLKSRYAAASFENEACGITRYAIGKYSIGNLDISVPLLEDQITIARFLDRETSKLDTLIAKQEHLIELLQEKRQAIISHAVTKGLNPDAKMKDSGVEWLGRIPAEWATAPLKKLLVKPLMYGANEASDEAIPENPRYVRITDIDVDGNLRDDTFRSLPKNIAAPYLLSDGDILLARSGGTVGKSFIFRDAWGICCFAGYLIKASADKNIMDADFMYTCFQSTFYWQYINSEQIQATIQNVSAERYGNFKIPVPPIKEQRGIVLFLNQQTAKIDNLIEKAKRSIELAKEHRSALITAAVTGKIDVREAA